MSDKAIDTAARQRSAACRHALAEGLALPPFAIVQSVGGLLLLAALGSFASGARADAAAGEAVFAQCAGCHAVGPGAANRFGPALNGLFERGAGAVQDYAYSSAFAAKVEAGLDWNEETLGAYLEAPMSYLPGTKMAYPGLQSADERADVIDYLATFAADGSTIGTEEAPAAQSASATEQAAVSGTVMPGEEAGPVRLAADVPVPEHGVLHLGRPALAEEVAAWDIDIRPDGAGLPAGSGGAVKGGELYDAQCASCHGVFGEGEGRWPMLAGGFDTLSDERPEKTIGSYWPYLSTVYDYVRRAMPFGNARSLSDDEVYALTAYLLYLNDLVDEEFVLDSDNFTDIEMPNEARFIHDTRAAEPWFEAGGEPCMSDCVEGEATVAMRARVLDVTPDGEGDEEGTGGLD